MFEREWARQQREQPWRKLWPYTFRRSSRPARPKPRGTTIYEFYGIREPAWPTVERVNQSYDGLSLEQEWGASGHLSKVQNGCGSPVRCFCSSDNFGTRINLRKHQIRDHCRGSLFFNDGSRRRKLWAPRWVCSVCLEDVGGFPRIQPLAEHEKKCFGFGLHEFPKNVDLRLQTVEQLQIFPGVREAPWWS